MVVTTVSYDGIPKVDPYSKEEPTGAAILRVAGKTEYPTDDKLLRFVATQPLQFSDSRNASTIVSLSVEAERIARESPGRDVMVMGRALGMAFGVPMAAEMLKWQPSWVLGPDRYLMIIPSLTGGQAHLSINQKMRLREILASLWN